MRFALAAFLALGLVCASSLSRAETKKEYETRFLTMMEISQRLDDTAKLHLGDKGLLRYLHELADANAKSAEQMTPPKEYSNLHPSFLLVLENIERSLYFAMDGKMERYRHFQKLKNKELQLLEEIAANTGLDLYRLGRGC
jgi:hypothetical protein